MKQSLQIRLGQQLTMTPQLQQAIRLLQLSSLDLQQEIQEALDSNIMLEVTEDQPQGEEQASNSQSESSSDKQSDSNKEVTAKEAEFETPSSDDMRLDETNTMPDELPVDSSWDETYEPLSNYPTSGGAGGEDYNFIENSGKTEDNLHEHLMWQVEMTPFSPTDRAIADAIVDAIDDDGYLKQSIEEIHQCVAGEGASFDSEDGLELDEVEAVLRQIQNFEPPGVGARDLGENLSIQLRHLPNDTPWLSEAQMLVTQYIDLLGKRDFAALKRRMRINEEGLIKVIELVKTLNPRPGSQITDQTPHYITPDVFVRKYNDRWIVDLNPEVTPNLQVNEQYASLMRSIKKKSDVTSMKEQLQEARWFIKSLESRNETLLKVARCIVDFQQEFFNHGDEHMRALVLHDVAEQVGMHESTISRVTNQKYMHTPTGIYELKYFFSSHVSTASGGEASATAIRAIIKKLIAAEDTRKPLSDSKISQLLADQNYKVARRTVAKYRESMSIPPSNERKSIA